MIKKTLLLFFFFLSLEAKELKAILHVEGMTCPLCTTAIKKSLKNLQGVKEAKVILNTKKATIYFDEKLPKESLIDAVKKAGYSAKIESIE